MGVCSCSGAEGLGTAPGQQTCRCPGSAAMGHFTSISRGNVRRKVTAGISRKILNHVSFQKGFLLGPPGFSHSLTSGAKGCVPPQMSVPPGHAPPGTASQWGNPQALRLGVGPVHPPGQQGFSSPGWSQTLSARHPLFSSSLWPHICAQGAPSSPLKLGEALGPTLVNDRGAEVTRVTHGQSIKELAPLLHLPCPC